MGRNAVGSACCVVLVKEPSELIVNRRGSPRCSWFDWLHGQGAGQGATQCSIGRRRISQGATQGTVVRRRVSQGATQGIVA